MAHFRLTYEIITPESAEHGDCAERGFLDARETRHPLDRDSDAEPPTVTLRQAIDILGCLEGDGCGTDYYEADGRQNYRTGEETRRALHCPDNITPASIDRVERALRKARLLTR